MALARAPKWLITLTDVRMHALRCTRVFQSRRNSFHFLSIKSRRARLCFYRVTVYYKVQGSISASRLVFIDCSCLRIILTATSTRTDFVFGYGINRQADLIERHTYIYIFIRCGGVYGRVYMYVSR